VMTHRTAPPIPVEPMPERPLGSARRSRSFHCDRHAASSTPGLRRRPLGRDPTSPSRGPADTHAAACGVAGTPPSGSAPGSQGTLLVGCGPPSPTPEPPVCSRCRCAARPTAGSGRWTAPLWDCAWAGPGGSRAVRPPSPINHNASSGGQVAGRAPGIAVVDTHAVGQAPADEDVAEHRLDRVHGDVFPPAVGGKLR